MDMSAAVPAKRPGASSSEADLRVSEVAALLSSKWSEGSGGEGYMPNDADADEEAAGDGPIELQD
jgi:hypothetical protein